MLQSLVHVCRTEFRFSPYSGTEVNSAHSCCCLPSHLVPPFWWKGFLSSCFSFILWILSTWPSVFLRSRVVKAKFFHQQLVWNFVNAIKLLRHKLFTSVLNNELSWAQWVPCRAPISSGIVLRWAPFRAIPGTGYGLTRSNKVLKSPLGLRDGICLRIKWF